MLEQDFLAEIAEEDDDDDEEEEEEASEGEDDDEKDETTQRQPKAAKKKAEGSSAGFSASMQAAMASSKKKSSLDEDLAIDTGCTVAEARKLRFSIMAFYKGEKALGFLKGHGFDGVTNRRAW
jgi:FtsZ-interacting cell division protein YlmF